MAATAFLTLFFDGAARDNGQGPAGAGAVLKNEAGDVVDRVSRFLGVRTNNEAEYEALIAGLEAALAREARRILVKGDSQLVIRQVRGEYEVKKAHLKSLHARAKELLARFESWEAIHIPREENAEADKCANEAIDLALKAIDLGLKRGCTFAAGDRVILDSTGERECGVIVHAWISHELGGLEDCYVAFFGPEFPEPGCPPAEKPYVLRYAAGSLRRAPR